MKSETIEKLGLLIYGPASLFLEYLHSGMGIIGILWLIAILLWRLDK